MAKSWIWKLIMILQLVYRYNLSLSKDENLKKKKNIRKLNKTKKTKAKRPKKNRKNKNFFRRESNPRPLTYKVNALTTAPRHQMLNIDVKVIIFNVFVCEILPVDTAWSW